MTKPEEAAETTESAAAPRRCRWVAIIATAAAIASAALTVLELTGSADADQAVACKVWAVGRPSVPVATTGNPLPFDGRLLPGTADCADPAGQISGVSFWMDENAKGRANCTGMEVVDAEVKLDWVMADGSGRSSTLRIGKLTMDGNGLRLENATNEGGPDSVAGKAVTVSADQETIDAAKAAAATQCAAGGVKNIVGTIDVHFG